MGNVNSDVTCNDQLVNKLKMLGYIESKEIECVFRAVDRMDYAISSSENLKNSVYKDLSWKSGNIHLSAPCIYAKVMEALSLKPGLSFLNIGSGTGYLNTIAGLILSSNGVNHGVEVNKDCFGYAQSRLDKLKKKSYIVDQFDFGEPVFIQGDFCKAVPNRQYDRVYCGAECPESHEAFIKQFVKPGGLLIMPYKGHLLKIQRLNEDIWKHEIIIPVTFEHLVAPNDISMETDYASVQLPLSQPRTLQDLCRLSIRSIIRQNLKSEYSKLMSYNKSGDKNNKCALDGSNKVTAYDFQKTKEQTLGGEGELLQHTNCYCTIENTLEISKASTCIHYTIIIQQNEQNIQEDKKNAILDQQKKNEHCDGVAYHNFVTSLIKTETLIEADSDDCSYQQGCYRNCSEDFLLKNVCCFNYDEIFSCEMKNRIFKLPLPMSLCMFINYYRNL